jgi:hypothetical protein
MIFMISNIKICPSLSHLVAGYIVLSMCWLSACTPASNSSNNLTKNNLNQTSANLNNSAGPGTDSGQVAKGALSDLRQLLDAQTCRALGIQSPDELVTATLGEPVNIYNVDTKAMIDLKPNDDVSKLLIDTHRRMYPVVVNGEGRFLIILEENNGTWKFVKPELESSVAKNLFKITQDKSVSGGSSSKATYIGIWMPDMKNLVFLGEKPKVPGGSGKNLKLFPLNDSGELQSFTEIRSYLEFEHHNVEFRAETEGSKNATEVFKALIPDAKRMLEKQKNGKKPS